MSGARVALLIATDTYSDSAFRQLRAPQHDVSALAEVLRDKEIGEYQVEVLVNKPSHQIRIRINELFQRAARNDLVLLYLSGHGIKDEAGRLHFAGVDTQRGLLASTAIPALWIRELMDASLARQVVLWLDCCYGGAFPAGMIPKATDSIDVVPQLTPSGRGSAVMTASTHLQFAFEGRDHLTDKIRPSVFTRAIVDGLRTGDADLNADGEIDVNELYGFVHERVTNETPNQTPTRNDQVTGEIYIAHSKRAHQLPFGLPAEIKQSLRSPRSEIRLGAVDMLFRLADSRNDAERAVATSALARLRAGPDPLLAEAATRPEPSPAPPNVQIPRLYAPARPPTPHTPLKLHMVGAAPPPVVTEEVVTRPAPAPVRLELPAFGRWAGLGHAQAWFLLAVVAGLLAADVYSIDHGTPQALIVAAAMLAAVAIVACGLFVISLLRLCSRSVTLRTNSKTATDVVFRPDAGALVCGGYPGSMWDTSNWIRRTETAPIGRCVAFSPDGATLAMAQTSYVRLFDPNASKQVAEFEEPVQSFAFSPDGSMLAVSFGNRLSFRRSSGWKWHGRIEEAHAGRINSLAFHPRANLLATAGGDRAIKLWKTRKLTELTTLKAHNHQVRMVAFSPDGNILASSDSIRIIFWSTESWTQIRVITRFVGGSGAIAFSPAGDLFAYASRLSGIRVVDLGGSEVRTLFGHRAAVTALAFSPTGDMLASASADGTVRLWPMRPSRQTAN